MAFYHRTLQLLNFLNVVMTGISLLMKENQQMLSIMILAKLSTVFLHYKFAQQLKSNNFCYYTVKWLLAFLNNRTQAVKCNNSVSSSVPVISGTPKDSVCGHLIFILFINDLPSVYSPFKIRLYADDVKIYFCITKPSDRIIL